MYDDDMLSVVAGVPSAKQVNVRLAEISGHLNALHQELVSVVKTAIDIRAWEGAGIHSPAQWLAWQTGLSPERAKQIVLIAHRVGDLPACFAAFTDGLLSVDQMSVVARRTPAHNDAEVCEMAKSATVAQLRAVLNKRFLDIPEPSTEQSPPASRTEPAHHARVGFDDDGNFSVHALADATDGAIIDAALREAHDALFRSGHTDVTWLDALVEVCTRSLGAVTSASRRDLFRIVIHVDTESAWLHNGPALPPTVLDLVLCDGVVQPVWTTGGLPVNVGRRRRIVPAHTRIIVENRDRICRHPTCHSRHGLEVHHIVHWNGPDHGRTDTDNLCCLCQRHHHDHHRGEFTITGNANEIGGLSFHDAHGRPIEPCGTPQPPGNNPPPTPRQPYRHPLGEPLHKKWVYFRPRPDDQTTQAAPDEPTHRLTG